MWDSFPKDASFIIWAFLLEFLYRAAKLRKIELPFLLEISLRYNKNLSIKTFGEKVEEPIRIPNLKHYIFPSPTSLISAGERLLFSALLYTSGFTFFSTLFFKTHNNFIGALVIAKNNIINIGEAYQYLSIAISLTYALVLYNNKWATAMNTLVNLEHISGRKIMAIIFARRVFGLIMAVLFWFFIFKIREWYPVIP